MSSVGSIGNSPYDIYKLLMSQSSSTSSTNSTSQTDASQGGGTTAAALLDNSSSAGSQTSIGSLRQLIESTVKDTLKQFQGQSNVNPKDVFNAVHDAVDKTLKQNGVDPSSLPPPPQFGGQGFPGGGGGFGSGGPSGGSSGGLSFGSSVGSSSGTGTSDTASLLESLLSQNDNTNSSSTSDSSNSSSTNTSTGTNTTNSTSTATSLDNLLSNFKVDPKQFKNDLLSALSKSQNQEGSIDFSALFQNFPSGQDLNVLA